MENLLNSNGHNTNMVGSIGPLDILINMMEWLPFFMLRNSHYIQLVAGTIRLIRCFPEDNSGVQNSPMGCSSCDVGTATLPHKELGRIEL